MAAGTWGRSVFVSLPESGALISEFTVSGEAVRAIGVPRATGFENDPDIHFALNAGIPLVAPEGGFYFVFQAGRPMVRKLDEAGAVVFERHVEGREIDGVLNALPTTWPRRQVGDRLLPLVPQLVRAAAVDASGSLWVSLAHVPVTYVYDAQGDRTRVVQFRGAGVIEPSGLFFAADGHLLVAPGCDIFDPRSLDRPGRIEGGR